MSMRDSMRHAPDSIHMHLYLDMYILTYPSYGVVMVIVTLLVIMECIMQHNINFGTIADR